LVQPRGQSMELYSGIEPFLINFLLQRSQELDRQRGFFFLQHEKILPHQSEQDAGLQGQRGFRVLVFFRPQRRSPRRTPCGYDGQAVNFAILPAALQ